MAKGKCKLPDCTVSATGTCLLNRDPAACENFAPDTMSPTELAVTTRTTADETPKPRASARTFHSGQELGTQDAAELMRSRYVHLVAILGCTDAGKTCLMSSLYLLAACRELLPRFRFAGSLTLQGFEDRARRLRKWEAGVLPTKLADHTVLSDFRSPSLLHIALRESSGDQARIDLLLTDLPGEWTKSFINNAESEKRFRFLHRADGIIIVIDGPSLFADKHGEIFNGKLLLSRLAESVKLDRTLPLILLISKCDRLQDGQAPEVGALVAHGISLGFAPEVIMAAAFSSVPEKLPNGTGVLAAIEKVIDHEFLLDSAESMVRTSGRRNFQTFRLRAQPKDSNE